MPAPNKINKVDREVAISEVNKWLDYKQIDDATREANDDSIKKLVNAISDGYLVLNKDNFHFSYTLKFPTDGEDPVTALEFKSRINMALAHNRMQNIKPNDFLGMLFAYASALTGKPMGVIKAIDSVDNSVVQAITVFFM